MDCKLEFPPSSYVQLFIHDSCWMKVINEIFLVQTILLETNEEGKTITKLETILIIKVVRNWEINEYLIKWKNLRMEEVRCEDELFM